MNATVVLTIARELPAAAEPDPSVAAGREALDQWWWWSRYPWYDAPTDGVRHVEIAKPWDWLWDWLPDWNFSLRGLFPTNTMQWIAWIAIAVLLAALAYLLVRAYRRRGEHVDASEQQTTSPEDDDADRVASLPFPVRPGRGDLLAQARYHYQRGDYGQAVVYLFSFQLVQLDKNHLIRLTKGKTNRQYLREIGPRGTLPRLIEQTMVAFEDVFFGNHTLDRTRFESCWSRLDEFRSLATEGAQ